MATKIVGRESKAWIAAATLTYELSCAGLASCVTTKVFNAENQSGYTGFTLINWVSRTGLTILMAAITFST